MNAPIKTPLAGERIIHDSRHETSPQLSIVVSVYNTEQFLEETLDSLVSAGTADLELVIVDDGSTDQSREIVLRWLEGTGTPGVLIAQANRGCGGARNTGLRHARGSYAAFMDSDDLFDAATYIHMMKLAATYGSDMVGARAICFDSATWWMFDFPHAHIMDGILADRPIFHTTLAREPRLMRLGPYAPVWLFRRSFLERIGYAFPENLLFEDVPMHVRAVTQARSITLLNETGLYYRIGRKGQITNSQGARRFDMLEIVRLALSEADGANLPVEAGIAFAGFCATVIHSCGQSVPLEQRRRYYSDAVEIFSRLPADWRTTCARRDAVDARESILVSALNGHALELLLLLSEHGRRLHPILHGGSVVRFFGSWSGQQSLLWLVRQTVRKVRTRSFLR